VAPNSAFLPKKLRTPTGHIATGRDFATADRRIFAVGAVRSDYGGYVIEAMAEGTNAAQVATQLWAN
jgi:thioredoxin reductase